jgi:hypothetical protein
MATTANNPPQSQSSGYLLGDDSNSSNPGTPPPSPQIVNSKIMVVAVAVLFAVVVFIFCLHIYAKWFWHHQDAGVLRAGRGSWRGRSSRRRTIDPLADDDQQQPHRPLFLLQSVGLEKSVVESLPTFVYKKEDFVAADGSSLPPQQQQLECAVCLEEFKENETGRTLPKCGHSFHVECIDMWFHSHSSCPLCRTSAQPDGLAASTEKPSTALALTVAAHEGDGEETLTGNPSPSPSPAASTMDPSLAAATTTAAVGRNLQQQEAADKPQIPPNVLFWGVGVGPTSLEQQEATSQHLRAVAAVAASGRSSSSSSSARVRAPFQVAIDIPQASSTTAAFETTSSPFSTPKSPMGRFITFTRLLSRGKSIAAAAAAAAAASPSSSSSSSSPPILHLPVDSEQAPAPSRIAAEP